MVMVKAVNEMLMEMLLMNVLIHTIPRGRREPN